MLDAAFDAASPRKDVSDDRVGDVCDEGGGGGGMAARACVSRFASC